MISCFYQENKFLWLLINNTSFSRFFSYMYYCNHHNSYYALFMWPILTTSLTTNPLKENWNLFGFYSAVEQKTQTFQQSTQVSLQSTEEFAIMFPHLFLEYCLQFYSTVVVIFSCIWYSWCIAPLVSVPLNKIYDIFV